ncbi:hypothetical protein [Clostridium sp. UBA4548]|uniref:hypothetical protein n=1 Tax=Clostridium sp. UBA4548 TaxID=1946361 RepID=UPI0025BBD238|nr:hypothetical protein [Clostridium sp. UBA4548]
MSINKCNKLVYFNLSNEEDVEILNYFKNKNFSKWVKRKAEEEIRKVKNEEK